MTDTRQCPRDGCTATVPSYMFACRSHWFSLPSGIRSRIWRAWRAYQRDEGTLEQLENAHAAAFQYWGQA